MAILVRVFRKFLADLIDYLKTECGIVVSSDTILLHLLWADDLILVSDTPQGLQTQLDELYEFCKKSHMIVNEIKTKVMIFGKREEFKFMYNSKELDVVKNYKYLGVIFQSISRCDCNLFHDAYLHVACQARKAMFKILKDTKKIGMIPPKVALQLFDSLVLPILEYSSEIWFSNKEIQELEAVHLKFLKIILGVNNNCSTLAVRGETGRYPILIRQKIKTLKFWRKIISMPDESLLKKMYLILCELNDCGYRTWASNIEELLNEVHLDMLWKEQYFDLRHIQSVCSTLYSNYDNMWYQSINDGISNPKLRTYCIFKSNFMIEPYLVTILDFKIRKQLTRFRVSNHVLSIEKGRHTKPKTPIEKRLCIFCNLDKIEDEYHFLCECPHYSDLRNVFINKTFEMGFYGNFFNLFDVFHNDHMCFSLGKLITKMFKKRDETMKSK